MRTNKELYLFLQSSRNDLEIRSWLSEKEEGWNGKDKQESIYRLFARLGCISKINRDFHICHGNFNKNSIHRQKSIRDIFFTSKNEETCLKDKGDASDLTGIHKSDPKHLLVCTSKCIHHLSLKKLEIDNIVTNFRQHEQKGYTMTLGIVVKDAQDYYSSLQRSESSSLELKKLILSYQPIVVDWNDLQEAYHHFKSIFGESSFDDLIQGEKTPLLFRFHQTLARRKIMRLKRTTNKVLLGCIQRSGKSYILGGAIIDDSYGKSTCNYMVITTAPNETILQYLEVFGYSQFDDFNVIHLDGKSPKIPMVKEKNIILCSKQFLQTKLEDKTRNIPWLKNMKFDMRFVDESHYGGTTTLAQKTLDYYGHDSFTVFITATYSKPSQHYNISREHWILWDMEDIKLCKNIEEEKNVARLVEKHGDDIPRLLQEYSSENIRMDFSKYPELEILTMNIKEEVLPKILNDTKDNLYGWSSDACFLLKQGVLHDNMKDVNNKIVYEPEFQNEKENLRLWHTLFGKYNEYNIPDKEYPDDLVFMKRVEKICKNPLTASRFLGDMDQHVIMAFLPPHNIELVSQATKRLLEKEKVIPNFDVLCINSKTTTDPKQSILDAKRKAKNTGKKGVLVLSGRQCSLGVTIQDCDIVLLLNNTNSYDMVFQMMFRCMTEGKGKKRGFVIDLNIHRMVETTLVEYGSIVQPNSHPKDSITYLLQERLINLNSDQWMPCFGHVASQLTTLTNSVYDVYSSKMSGALENLFQRMSLKQDLFSKNDYDMMKQIFHLSTISHKNTPLREKLQTLQILETLENVKKGMETIPVLLEQDSSYLQEEETQSMNDIHDDIHDIYTMNPIDILRPLSIVISLLTIHNHDKTTLEEMFSLVDGNIHKKTILLHQTRAWWGKGVSNENVEVLVKIFQTYLEKDQETSSLIRHVKELFCKNIKNSKELSKIIDKYLIPQENEKKKNAEVSTPIKLREEMLETIPPMFWTTKKKVFEPCCGKGGFLMDIVDKFMTGLEATLQDEKERYRCIVEECLYFSDINDMNIFICRLLLDPYQEYKLQYNVGDTLKLDVKMKWGVDGFDAVIGNPPYQDCHATGDNKLYLEFIKYSIDILYTDQYLLFIVPLNIKNYITNQNKNRSYFQNFYDIQYLTLNTPNTYFPTISTYFSYFLLRKRIVETCEVHVSYIRKKQVESSTITLHEKDNIPLCLSTVDLQIMNKVSNLVKTNWPAFTIQRALYIKDSKKSKLADVMKVTQRIRNTHLVKGEIKKHADDEFRYKIIDKVNKSNPFPGLFYYYNHKMIEYGKPKVIMCTGGYLMPSYDEEGIYNLSDNMLYMLVDNKEEYEGLKKLIDSDLIRYLNKMTMTDNIHGRDKVMMNMKKIDLSRIKSNEDVYVVYGLSKEEITCIKNSI